MNENPYKKAPNDQSFCMVLRGGGFGRGSACGFISSTNLLTVSVLIKTFYFT